MVCAMLAGGLAATTLAAGPVYSIYEIQNTTDVQGRSPLEGQVVDCLGGIVTHKYGGFRPKLTIQDPNSPTGWGAIQVKDWLTGAPLFNKASVGDWVTLSNVFVEEFRGNTILQCFGDYQPTLTVVSTDNPIPEPLEVSPAEIASPVRDAYGDWYVQTHDAERYEHMLVKVRNVVVTQLDLGKATDNYVLEDLDAQSPSSCWATDYMNEDSQGNYHPHVQIGRQFCSVRGILEQYTNLREGWDYYQLVTTATGDLSIARQADFDNSCVVDLLDFRTLAGYWGTKSCDDQPQACEGADLDGDGAIGLGDLALFSHQWLGPSDEYEWQ